MKIFALIQMVLAVALTVAFAVLARQTEAGKLAKAMEATSRSLEEAAKVTRSAREYYGSLGESLNKSGEAMVSLAPSIRGLGEQTGAMGKMLHDFQVPSSLKMEGLRPVLDYTKPFEKNDFIRYGEDLKKVGDAFETSGPQLIRMGREAPKIQRSLDEMGEQLTLASQELKRPVQGNNGLLILGLATGLLMFFQSLTLLILVHRRRY
ncbi:MAG: hypothetical protein SFY92_07015 [Verrucomicrobiae bacterium]|nr:hypothetical protein [Verrucomicrobiae bacterium]